MPLPGSLRFWQGNALSYDLHVFGRRRPRAANLEEFLDAAGTDLRASGPWKGSGGVLVEDAAGGAVEVDGPDRVAPEDLPDAAAGAVGAAGWLVALSVKGAPDAAWPAELATHLARAGDGVVYDPQTDAVTWPRRWRPRPAEERRELIDTVELAWYLAGRAPARWAALRLLELLRERCPAALPRRYGDTEPFRHRFEGKDAEGEFADFWAARVEDPLGLFFWTATRPCLGATVTTTGPGGPHHPRARPCTRIELVLDARPCFRDPGFLESLVDLFAEVAGALRSPYAAGCLNRDFVLRRNAAFSGGGEASPLPFPPDWVGLPASPTWLAWFGPPYDELVRPAVEGAVARASDDGLLVRLATEPLHADELAAVFPPLPERLLARADEDAPGRWLPGARYSLGAPPPETPAVEVPPLPEPSPRSHAR